MKNLLNSMEVCTKHSPSLSSVQLPSRLINPRMTYRRLNRFVPMTNSYSSLVSGTTMSRVTCSFKRRMELGTTQSTVKRILNLSSPLGQCWLTKILYFSLQIRALSASWTCGASLQQKMIFMSTAWLSSRRHQLLLE